MHVPLIILKYMHNIIHYIFLDNKCTNAKGKLNLPQWALQWTMGGLLKCTELAVSKDNEYNYRFQLS